MARQMGMLAVIAIATGLMLGAEALAGGHGKGGSRQSHGGYHTPHAGHPKSSPDYHKPHPDYRKPGHDPYKWHPDYKKPGYDYKYRHHYHKSRYGYGKSDSRIVPFMDEDDEEAGPPVEEP